MLKTAFIAALCCVVLSANAQARHRTYTADPSCNSTIPNGMSCAGVTSSPRGERVVRAMKGFGVAQKVYRAKVSQANPQARQGREVVSYGAPTPSVEYSARNIATQIIGGRPAGCPHAFCGCGASLHIFGRIIPALNLAANWVRMFPRAAPAPGMAAARPGHVFVLEQHIQGDVWLAHDSNSGHGLTRLHARSIAGYTIVNPHGSG